MASVHRLGIASRQRTVEIPGVAERVVIDHQAIVQAIKNHDPAAAAAAVQRHLDMLKQKLAHEALAEGAADSPR
jgi:DNA-binding FadR family transcriptional regulator